MAVTGSCVLMTAPQSVLIEDGLDAFAEASCWPYLPGQDGSALGPARALIPDAPGGLFRGLQQRARSGVALPGFAFAAGVPATGEP